MITRETLIKQLGQMLMQILEAQDTLVVAGRRIEELEAKVKELEDEKKIQ